MGWAKDFPQNREMEEEMEEQKMGWRCFNDSKIRLIYFHLLVQWFVISVIEIVFFFFTFVTLYTCHLEALAHKILFKWTRFHIHRQRWTNRGPEGNWLP